MQIYPIADRLVRAGPWLFISERKIDYHFPKLTKYYNDMKLKDKEKPMSHTFGAINTHTNIRTNSKK